MKLTIFKVCVPMQDQETCDRMKQVCVDNGLPIIFDIPFTFNKNYNIFYYFDYQDRFCIWNDSSKTQVTEPEFLTLLNEYKSKENGK